MRRLVRGWTLAAAALVASAGCEVAQPTEPALTAPSAAAPAESRGQGAQFSPLIGPGVLYPLADEEGNSCVVGFSAQEGGKTRNDFNRFGPDGSLSQHTSDSEATLTVVHQGVLYEGVGHATAALRIDLATGFAIDQFVLNANGKVLGPDGESHHASCSGRVNEDGLTVDADIEVR